MPDEPADRPADQDAPSLTAGALLGHYEVLTCIGSGGMGEVYRARDHHLARDVAIKVLRRHILERPRARVDFANEAKALSRLTHPNIATIHDFDTQDGIDFLVMEFVNGESLADRVRKGPLPHEEWTSIGRQICEALGAAHTKGIVHRDLKPRNVFLDEWGHVKVLDFGLAKLAPEYLDSTATTQRESQTGRIVGTPPYMAPEQLRGERVDHRTDIYALGVTLYEMATGRRAFSAPTRAELIACVLEREPERPKKLRPDISSELEHTVVRAMSRDPQHRHQSADELRAELRPPLEGRIDPGRIARAVLWLALVMLIVMAGRWFSDQRKPGWVPPKLSAIVRDPTPETNGTMALSPDGNWITYSVQGEGGESLWRTARVGGASERLIDSYGRVAAHCWSPDSRQIAVVGIRGGQNYLQIIPAFGDVPNPPIPIPEEVGWPTTVSWSRESIFIGCYGTGLWSYGLDDREFRRRLTSHDGYIYRQISVCARGDHALLEAQRGQAKSLRRIDLVSGSLVELEVEGADPIWAGLGCRRIIYAANETGRHEIWIADIESGARQSLTFGVGTKSPIAASDDGRTLIYQSDQENRDLWILDPEPSAKLRRIQRPPRAQRWPSADVDGSRIVFQRDPESAHGVEYYAAEIAIGRVSHGELVDVKAIVARGGMPILSKDAAWIAYLAGEHGRVLHATEVATLRTLKISSSVVLSNFHAYPFQPLENYIAWSSRDVALYAVESRADSSHAVIAWRPEGTSVLYAADDKHIRFVDLFAGQDGNTIAWAEKDISRGIWRVRRFDRAHEASNIVFERESTPSLERLLIRGLLDDGTLIVVEVHRLPRADTSENVILHGVHPEEGDRILGEIERIFSGTLRLDARRERLYYTGVTSERKQQLRCYDLPSGEEMLLSDAHSEYATIGATAVLRDGSLVCTQQETGTEFALVEFSADPLAMGR